MKKKLLIVNNNLCIGGIQKSLVNLLSQIHNDYEITLFLFKKRGELSDEVPPDVRVIEAPRRLGVLGMPQSEAKRAGLVIYALRTLCAAWSKLFSVRLPFLLLTRSFKLKESFDYAVSFMQNASPKLFYGGCNEFVLNSVTAQKKVCFIHCDYKNYEGRCEYNTDVIRAFDAVAACSESCRRRFLEVVPREDVYAVHNCYNLEKLRTMGEEYSVKLSDSFNILSVARISGEKGILRMLPILECLSHRASFMWHVVGDGVERAEAERLIKKLSLEGCVTLWGEKKNPYPYFKAADLLLVPSYNEAAPMVYGEAQFFKLPVLTTDTTSAAELVTERGGGAVCENTDSAIESALYKCITEKDIRVESPMLDNTQAAAEFEMLFPH